MHNSLEKEREDEEDDEFYLDQYLKSASPSESSEAEKEEKMKKRAYSDSSSSTFRPKSFRSRLVIVKMMPNTKLKRLLKN